MYAQGEGVRKDVRVAMAIFKKTSDAGSILGKRNYALLLLQNSDDKTFETNARMARKLLKEIVLESDDEVESQYYYANMCYKGEGGERDLMEAKLYMQKAAEKVKKKKEKMKRAKRVK